METVIVANISDAIYTICSTAITGDPVAELELLIMSTEVPQLVLSSLSFIHKWITVPLLQVNQYPCSIYHDISLGWWPSTKTVRWKLYEFTDLDELQHVYKPSITCL